MQRHSEGGFWDGRKDAQERIHRCEKHHKDYTGPACPNCQDEFMDSIDGSIKADLEVRCTPSQLGDCLDEAKKTICGERQDVYGSPEDSFAIIAEYWSTYLRAEYEKVGHRNLNTKDVAHMMVLFKMARVQGQAPKRDNYVDLCGYAAIAADRLSSCGELTKEEMEFFCKDFPAAVTPAWKDGAPGCPHTRTKFVKTTAGDYRQCLGCGARLEVE